MDAIMHTYINLIQRVCSQEDDARIPLGIPQEEAHYAITCSVDEIPRHKENIGFVQ